MTGTAKRRFPRGRDTGPDARLVVIGLGSNSDGPVKIDEAITEIAYEFDLLARSTRYVSPVSPPNEEAAEGEVASEADAPAMDKGVEHYSNAAVLVRTSVEHDDLKATLNRIELVLGRDRSRPEHVAIDLDILLIQNQIVRKGSKILVPHPDLETRRYAAIPSAEVAPFLKHTVSERPLSEIAAALA